MKITCESCGAKYTIADDKVRGRKVKIRCKGCGTPIVVDGQHSAASSEDSSSPGDGEAAVSVEVPPSLPPDSEWSVNLSETEQLSLTTAQVAEAWQAGRIGADAFVWREGMGDWVPIQECAELAPHLTAPAPAASPSPAAEEAAPAAPAPEKSEKAPVARSEGSLRPAARAIKPTGAAARGNAVAARVSGGRAQGAPDLFAGVDKAGADEEEVSTSAPILPQAGTSGAAEKATGARNENSVLFSLDALKAGFAGPAPKPEEKRPGATIPSEDPFGMGGGGGPLLAGLGGSGNTLFSLADNQNLLTAPAPPEPPKAVAASYVPAGGPSAAPIPSKKKTILVAVAGAGILSVGLALGLGLSGSEKEAPESVASAALTDKDREGPSDSAKATEPREEASKQQAANEEPKKDELKDDPKKEPETEPASASANSGDKAADTKEASAAAAPASKTSTSTASSSKDTKKAPAKEEPKSTSAAAAQPFNKGAAVSALSAAAGSAGSCKKIGGPTGSGKVQVTFAPSGRVTSATVTGAPFAGTSVGGCVASIFRRSKVPPFSGSSITVSKSFAIR